MISQAPASRVERFVQAQCRANRSDGDPPEVALADALNTTLMHLENVATERGYRLDFAERATSATDVEFVSAEEFHRRPEVVWLALAKSLHPALHPDLTPEEALEVVREYRRAVRRSGLFSRTAVAS